MSLFVRPPEDWAETRRVVEKLETWVTQAEYLADRLEERTADRNCRAVDRALGELRHRARETASADAADDRLKADSTDELALLLRMSQSATLDEARLCVREVRGVLSVVRELEQLWAETSVRCALVSDDALAQQDEIGTEEFRSVPDRVWRQVQDVVAVVRSRCGGILASE